MKTNIELFLEKVKENEELRMKFLEAEEVGEVQEIAKELGVELAEAEVMELRNIMEKAFEVCENGELSEDDLENVAGGDMGVSATIATGVAISVISNDLSKGRDGQIARAARSVWRAVRRRW